MVLIYLLIFLLTIYLPKYSVCYEYGSENSETCADYRQRRAKHLKLPCKEILELGYCLAAGNHYPWKAVNHFINENRGLMKRLYGKEEQFSILSAELQSNFIPQYDNIYDKNEFSRSRKFGRNLDKNIGIKNSNLRSKLLKVANSIYNTRFIYNADIETELPIIIKTLTSNKDDESILDAVNMSIETNFLDDNVTHSNLNTTTTITTTHTTLSPTTTTTSYQNTSINHESHASTINETTDPTVNFETTTLENEATTLSNVNNNENEIDHKSESTVSHETGTLLNEDEENFELESDTENFNFQYEGVNACEVTEEVVAPYWANSTSGETLALLNTYPYEQYVHWEKCRSLNKKMHCRQGCRCEQQHRLYRLLAYDPKNECRGVFMDWFKLPCCCICRCYDIPTQIKKTSRTPRGLQKETFYNFRKT